MSGLGALATKRFDLDSIPNLAGRVAIVTGGTAGIGYEIGAYLALHNAKVTILGSNDDRGNDTVESINQLIKENHSQGEIDFMQCDFQSLKQVDQAAKDLLKHNQRLDMLINNAGIGVSAFALTNPDNLGNHFEINNLSHWHLTKMLTPLLISTAKQTSTRQNSVRVVWQSSELHRMVPSDVEFKNRQEVSHGDMDPTKLYGRSKLGNILSAKEFAKKEFASTGVLSLAVHPGVVSTPQQKQFGQPGGYGKLGKILEPLVRAIAKKPDQGAECALWAATWPDVDESDDGQYFSEPFGKKGTETDKAKDERLAANFRHLCEQLESEILG